MTLSEALKELASNVRSNSERWFPSLHSLGYEQIRLHYALGLSGEVGEVANLFKKIHTGKKSFEELETDIGYELADVFTYLILLADECGVDIVKNFNEKQKICENRWGEK